MGWLLAALRIVPAILDLFAAIGRWFAERAAEQRGSAAQAARDIAVAEKVETAIAKAEADAPKTEDAVEERMRNGTF